MPPFIVLLLALLLVLRVLSPLRRFSSDPCRSTPADIKEVNFLGARDQVVAAGSDCGRVFLYDAESGAVLRALEADEDVANCVQVCGQGWCVARVIRGS